jgi:branched-chain amino acid aminotransferase
LIHQYREHKVGDGEVGPLTRALRERLVAIQRGEVEDRYGWLSKI